MGCIVWFRRQMANRFDRPPLWVRFSALSQRFKPLYLRT